MPPLEPCALIIIVLGGLGMTSCEAESSSAPPMKGCFMTYTSGSIGFASHADEDVTVDGDADDAVEDGEGSMEGSACRIGGEAAAVGHAPSE